MSEIRNATITAVRWDRERGLTHNITVEGEAWGCTLGGYHLGGTACYEWITALMDALEIWEMDDKSLIGKVVRAEFDGCMITAIGHPIKDKWIRPKELFAKYAEEKTK